MRHEVGHALGLRHEHIRVSQSNPACDESDDWDSLTPFDPESVMAYDFCDGTLGTHEQLTLLDRLGVAYLYNLPESGHSSDYTPPPFPQWPGTDDIFWYRPGETENELWLSEYDPNNPSQPISFDSQQSCLQAPCVPNPVSGKPFNFRNVEGHQDIFIYAQGTDSYHLVNNGLPAPFTVGYPVSISGTRYVPSVFPAHGPAVSNAEDILWYAPRTQSSIWHGDTATTFTATYPNPPDYAYPISGRLGPDPSSVEWDSLWYSPSASTSDAWSWKDVHKTTSCANTHWTLEPGDHYIPLVGDFFEEGTGMDEILWYAPYGTGEKLVLWAGLPCDAGATSWTFPAWSVSDGAKPILGDFDGNGLTDVFFYAQGPGSGPLHDVVAFEGGSVPNVTLSSPSIDPGGDYSPFPRDFNGDDCTDILWFAPHDTTSPLWRSTCDGDFVEDEAVTHPTGAYPVGYGMRNRGGL